MNPRHGSPSPCIERGVLRGRPGTPTDRYLVQHRQCYTLTCLAVSNCPQYIPHTRTCTHTHTHTHISVVPPVPCFPLGSMACSCSPVCLPHPSHTTGAWGKGCAVGTRFNSGSRAHLATGAQGGVFARTHGRLSRAHGRLLSHSDARASSRSVRTQGRLSVCTPSRTQYASYSHVRTLCRLSAIRTPCRLFSVGHHGVFVRSSLRAGEQLDHCSCTS